MSQILGVDSEFCNVEAFVTGVVDHFSEYLRPIRRKFTLGVVCLMMVLGIPMVTRVRDACGANKIVYVITVTLGRRKYNCSVYGQIIY